MKKRKEYKYEPMHIILLINNMILLSIIRSEVEINE